MCQLIAWGVWAHRPPRVVVTAEGTLGVPEQQLGSFDSMGHAQTAVSAPWEGQGEILGPSYKAMTVQGCRSLEGQGTFFWPSLLCHPRAGPPILTHITNPAPFSAHCSAGTCQVPDQERGFSIPLQPPHSPPLAPSTGWHEPGRLHAPPRMPHTPCLAPSHPHNHTGAEAAQKQEN